LDVVDLLGTDHIPVLRLAHAAGRRHLDLDHVLVHILAVADTTAGHQKSDLDGSVASMLYFDF
jgi:hypothetical protein